MQRFAEVSRKEWVDWKWQLRNRLDNGGDITDVFPNLGDAEVALYKEYISRFHIGLTPYLLSLIELDEDKNPVKNDPIWKQFKYFDHSLEKEYTGYDGSTINWEVCEEMPTRLLQHKYPDRAIIRITDCCFGYCNYCYLTMRTLDLSRPSHNKVKLDEWKESMHYLRANHQIRDILISGGDPLLLSNSQLKRVFKELRSLKSIKTIRLNTRALTFNPFRFDEELLTLFKEYGLTALEIHIAHPKEITDEVDSVLQKMDDVGYRPLILWRSPLLRGVNNSYNVLEELFIKLYERRIVPYYLFHYTPYALGRSVLATSIREGVNLMLSLRRHVPGIAFPRYTLFHPSGKQDIPLDPDGTPTFRYKLTDEGAQIVEFKNWKGNWVVYPDVIQR